LLLAFIQKALAQVIALDISELDPEESLFTYGLDSLMALELQHVLETSLDVRLPMETLMGGVTLNALTSRLLASINAPQAESGQQSAQMTGSARTEI
jgi:acyl carrier protein